MVEGSQKHHPNPLGPEPINETTMKDVWEVSYLRVLLPGINGSLEDE
jgi:hypothetical protein